MPPPVPERLEIVARVCAGGSSAELAALRAELHKSSPAAALVDAAIALCAGDAARADRLLRHAWKAAAPPERRFVAELWVPILISMLHFEEAEAILGDERIDAQDVRFVALRAVLAATRGDAALSRQLAYDAEERIADDADEVVRARLHQRLALAALHRTEPEESLRHAAAAIGIATAARAHRIASSAHSVAYVTHLSITGDVLAALHHAREMAASAMVAGDRAFRTAGLVAVYEMLVEMADDAGAASALELLRASPLPEQFNERFPSRVADAMVQASGGDFAGARNVFVVLADEENRTPGERALCRALAGLCNLGAGDEDAARALSRRAIGGTARPPAGLPAYELRYRRLGRAIGCATCVLLGDTVRADRRSDTAALRVDADVAGLVDAGRGVPAARLSPKVRGYARLIELVHARRAATLSAGPLTATELEIFRQLDAGRNAPQIAAALGRSTYTVRTHVRNAIEKLNARGRLEALARARKLGLL
ncbi:MAG TPA: LuxR C-terminal-related transcriptional regulator [Candidatus Elarobacter sp.]